MASPISFSVQSAGRQLDKERLNGSSNEDRNFSI